METYCYSEIFYFLEILINVKAGRVNEGARKVHHALHGARGRRVGQAWSIPSLIDVRSVSHMVWRIQVCSIGFNEGRN
jgi:hypothetical protein